MTRQPRKESSKEFIFAYGRGVLILLVVLFADHSLVHAETVRAEAGIRCLPSFPLQEGWLGADAAYSIPLPDGRSVWIFGDTLYGERRTVNGEEPRMVRNSIGVSRCDAKGQWSLRYVIRHAQSGSPLDFFQAQVLHPKESHTWYWALDGFVRDKELWVTLLCVRNARIKRPGGFNFETCGADLARVSGLDADPQNWEVKYFPLVRDGVAAYPSATAVVNEGYVYLFALYEKDARPMLLTRIPLAALDAPAANLQFLAKEKKDKKEPGKWEPGFRPGFAWAVMDRGTSEMTIRYHPDLKKWLAVMRSPDLSSDAIVVRTAPAITGPWSPAEAVYHIPELQKDSPEYDKNVFCYAGKEHPEFERPGSLVITYVCNTMKVPNLVTNSKIYVPKVIEVPVPATMASHPIPDPTKSGVEGN